MNATESIRSSIIGHGRGWIFSADDFLSLASSESIRQSLCSLISESFIVRLARGIYCFPTLEGENSFRMMLPSPETIAECIASREKVRIIPDSTSAAYLSGLSPVRQLENKYLTDGAPRCIHLSNGRSIIFKHTSESKLFAFSSEKMRNLSQAMRYLGSARIDDDIRRIIRNRLREISEEDFNRDIVLPPAWVCEILMELWNS